jgi:hypothetical protein
LNPRIAKAFNVIEASKASASILAGLLISRWNPFVEWMGSLYGID